MRTVRILAQPDVAVFGTLEIPDNIENVYDYIDDHLDDVEYDEPELSYGNMSYDICSIT